MTRPSRPGRRLRIVLWTIIGLIALAGAWLTRGGTRWPSVYYMTGPSMEPTIAAEQYFLAWSPPGDLHRGDLVIFRFVDEEEVFHVLRRLAGLPGDTVGMEDGVVVLNGARQPWPHQILAPAASWSALALTRNLFTWGPWIVPRDSVLLLADTRDMLGWPDSRFIGFVPQEHVIARATRRVTGQPLR
jgi:signal peptidase I